MRILHITHHLGCDENIKFVCKNLGYELETQFANWSYNVDKELAVKVYNQHKDYYNSFDLIITSDTASLARIFLQNGFKGKLLIWVCNRFDYYVHPSENAFPDDEFYELFRGASYLSNVKVYSYTKFEHEYAEKYRNVLWQNKTLKPCGFIDEDVNFVSTIPNKENLFFITRYYNDNIFMDLKAKCDELNIPNYRGQYNGPLDLKGVKGIIHIPYAWSNLALFENWHLGNVYFIPSEEFLLKLKAKGNFFWSPPFDEEFIRSSEWYLPEHKELFMYFNSFEELKQLTEDEELINKKKQIIKEFIPKYSIEMLNKWREAIEEFK